MTDYWDYVKENFKNPLFWTPMTFLTSAYEKAYEESHGSDRYYWSKVPIFSTWKQIKDGAKQAQDQYENTGKDPSYISRVPGFSGSSLTGDIGSANGFVRMAKSLSEMYTPEVIENLDSKFNFSYR